MSDDITGGLDLLGDWLDAKGYTEEAGLCTKAMDKINTLQTELTQERERCIHLYIALTNDTDEHMQKVVKALRGR